VTTGRIGLALLLLTAPAHAAERSSKVRRQFQAAHPCPSNGATKGNCPLWVVDHIVPLCWGGKDELSNLAWQRADEAKKKDVFEVQACALKRKYEKLQRACRLPAGAGPAQ